jgi:hypothetical protein
LHYNEPIPNKDLNLKNRDKQLCTPLIRLFQNTKSVKKIKQSLSKLLKEKKQRKAVTIEATLYSAVNSLAKEEVEKEQEQKSLDKDSVILEFATIWCVFMAEVGGILSSKNPRSMDTSEYGLISQQSISSILRDRFGGEDARDKKTRKLRFSLSKLEKLGANYSSDDIKIIEKPKKKTEKPKKKTKKKETAGDQGQGQGDPAGDQGDQGDQGDPAPTILSACLLTHAL